MNQEMLKLLKLRKVTPKIKMLVEIVEKGDYDISNFIEGIISSKNLETFISEMYSSKKTADILFNSSESMFRAIENNPIRVANFFNIFNCDISIPLSDINVLLSDELLKVVSIEWIRKYIFLNSKYYIKKQGNGYSLIKDEFDEFSDDVAINPFDENIKTLEQAIKNKKLLSWVNKMNEAF